MPRRVADPAVMRALAHPLRLAILAEMWDTDRPLRATDLAEILGRARPDGDAPHASGAGSGQPGPGAAILLDVREPREREICVIPGSLHIPLAEVLADPAGIADRLSLGGGTVYVHCLGGGRSLKAAQALAASGVHAVNVAGGIKAWWTQIDPSMPRY